MKKIVVVFLIMASVLSFYISFKQTDNEEIGTIEALEENMAKGFVIPDDPMLANPDELYPLLFETARELRINIFRPSINSKPDNSVEVIKYVLLTGDTNFFNHFNLKSGHFLTAEDTQQGNLFLSSAKIQDENQVGVIKDFGGNHLITIKPLRASYQYLRVAGPYFAEVSDDKALGRFLESFAQKLNAYYKKYNSQISYSPEDFKKTKIELVESAAASSLAYLTYCHDIILFIILLLFIYCIFNESKKIGILKMHGLSNHRLWYIVIGRLIIVAFMLTMILSLIFTFFIEDTTHVFIYNVLKDELKTYALITVCSLVSYFYISKIKVNQIIKNRKDTNGLFILNLLLKVVCSILLVIMGHSIFVQYMEISKKQKNLSHWEQGKDYGIFYPLYTGHDQNNLPGGFPEQIAVMNSDLYPILNQRGSVLINARQYEEQALRLNKDYDGIRSVKVNNNYLQEFPVYDIRNNPVHVSEDTTNWVLLVPVKYQSRQSQIIDFFEKTKKSYVDAEQKVLHREVPDRMIQAPIQIVWLANDQKIFSFNPDVFPAENNMILNPIIEVVTEKNSLAIYRDSILGGGSTDPLKIKLTDRDTALTYKSLEPELRKLRLDDNLKQLVTVDQYMLEQLYSLEKQMNQLWLISLGMVSGLLFLISQNIIVFFHKNQQKIVVRRLFGTDFFRTYKEYVYLFVMTWLFQLLVCFMVKGTVDSRMLAVSGIVVCIEIVASVIALLTVEKRNKVKVLKGG
ncbi:hypothetical protein YDYSG_08280 [Paenibacillus tyrfis]|uniref:bacteriocin-associated integral membrane family protein n=1 Tax=Paenibacillus tyrfis TaxID=1501230 RepID=UPI00249340B1|nr:DUF1430 domain-containing protein [Paenibacillus tyrfis]GLI04798.1 hypothetical protein YDYSG_08280 [Paenibacillus tyrfis]